MRQLKWSGYFVCALGRDAAKLDRVCALADERVVWDGLRTNARRGAREGMEQVVSCLGASVIPTLRDGSRSFTYVDAPANLRLIEAAEAARIERFVYVSVFTGGRLRHNDFVRGHEEVVESLRASNLGYTVIRPTGFFASLVQIMREPSWGLIPEHKHGTARTNPIHEADLAAFCLETLREKVGRQEFGVGGPEVLTRRQIADMIFQNYPASKSGRVVPISSLHAASFLLRPFNRRVSQLLVFIADVLSDDFTAPAYWSRTLAQYLASTNDTGKWEAGRVRTTGNTEGHGDNPEK